jgi:uncharacterized protein (DUF1684 family)
MKNLYIIIVLLLFCKNIYAQDYNASINKFREEYKKEFLTDKRSPLKPEELSDLRFYEPDESYVINAEFTRAAETKEFDMATHTGITKKYSTYGTLSFSLKGKEYHLNIYQNSALIKNPEYSDHLFIPFKDLTNGVDTYGGGRYLDFHISDITDHVLKIDFNKAYNPYCAYTEGYSCPIPPEENHLQTAIPAGEKIFGGEH